MTPSPVPDAPSPVPGTYVSVPPKAIQTGDVVLHHDQPYIVTLNEISYGVGYRLVMQHFTTRRITSSVFKPDTAIYRIQLPQRVAGVAENWTMRLGDVVVYPAARPGLTQAAVRGPRTWFSTLGRVPLSDARVLVDVGQGEALAVRTQTLRKTLRRDSHYYLGTVVALRDFLEPEPTVYVRRERNLWVGSTQVELSDDMVDHELRRGTYAPLYIPKRGRTT